MNLQEALKPIYSVKGASSLIAGIMNGDFDSLREQNATGKSLEQAKAELERHRELQRNCQSDYAYWGYQGDVSYWQSVVYILEAAEIVGDDNLPYVAPPQAGGVVMDMCFHIEGYGKKILELAKEKSPTQQSIKE